MHVDNIKAIFLSNNTFLSQRAEHIDMHNHFIRDYVEYRTVKIQFFHSKENLADPFTNNLSNGTFGSLT